MGRIIEILAESLTASETRALETLTSNATNTSLIEEHADILVALKLASHSPSSQVNDRQDIDLSVTPLGQSVLYAKLALYTVQLDSAQTCSDPSPLQPPQIALIKPTIKEHSFPSRHASW